MKVVENIISKNVKPTRSAAMYYKTEPFYTDISNYQHTNNWEIVKAIEILTNKGFSVDLIDRGNHSWTPKKRYDLFLGLGVGNSGKNFARYAKLSSAPKKVLLAMGPQPDISNKLVLDRYDAFYNRTGYLAPPMRTVQDVIDDKFIEIIDETDYIFCIGEKNTQSFNSFKKFNKPILNFYPAISPDIIYKGEWLKSRDLKSFLCFAGNGFICKGVDIVLESFLQNPDKHLHICGPSSEPSFFNYYKDKINVSSNIHYHGFIKPGGSKFNDLVSTCAFTIFNSAAEGCCTSVATTIKAGLIPVINSWTGINITDDIGITINNDGCLIKGTNEAIQTTTKFSDIEYKRAVTRLLKKAKIFSQDSFIESYTTAIECVLGDK